MFVIETLLSLSDLLVGGVSDGMQAMREDILQNKAQAWKNFINSGEIGQDAISAAIAESWRKCANTGVNPADGKGRIVLEQRDFRQLLEKNEVIIRVAKPFVEISISFSGPAQASYSHTLGMVVAAAEAISMQLRIQGKKVVFYFYRSWQGIRDTD